MLQVRNGKSCGFIGGNKIYVGRANGKLPRSPLANPFSIGKDGDRQEVCEKYRQWLWREIRLWQTTSQPTPAVLELQAIATMVVQEKDVILTCWCKPKLCHGDVVSRCVQWLVSQNLVCQNLVF